MFSVVKCLVMNGLPLRGDIEVTDFDEGVSGGLFLNTFGHLLFKMDPELEALASNENVLDPDRLKPLLENVLTIPWFDYLLKYVILQLIFVAI